MKTLPHALFYGGAGVGKTTLARVIRNELSIVYKRTVEFYEYTPAELDSVKAIAVLSSKIKAGDVVFIDEIHGLLKTIEESMYSIMQDFRLSLHGRAYSVPPFTMIGATTSSGELSRPLRDRFAIQIELDPANTDDLVAIINDQIEGKPEPVYLTDYHGQENAKTVLGAHLWSLPVEEKFLISNDIRTLVAERALGNPRMSKQILKHFVALQRLLKKTVSLEEASEWMEIIGIDKNGLHKPDIRVIQTLLNNKDKNGNLAPMGVNALASAVGITKADLESITEPRLEHCGFLRRTRGGRMLTEKAIKSYTPSSIYEKILETFGKER